MKKLMAKIMTFLVVCTMVVGMAIPVMAEDDAETVLIKCFICLNGEALDGWKAEVVDGKITVSLVSALQVYILEDVTTFEGESVPYVVEDGTVIINVEGIETECIKIWLINKVAPQGWVQDGYGVWHYYVDGEMTTGWQKVGGTWYYMDEEGNMLTGWQKIGGTWYYFKTGGQMVTGWQKLGNTWYYFKSGGAMVTGWQKIDNTWYFFKSSGAMAANEWCEGYWLNANGSWTYQPKGSWHQNSKGWWFGDTSGWYAKNTTIKIDNVNYKFDASGYWVK